MGFAHFCLHQLYPRQEWEKRTTIPALLCVVKIHKYHHISVGHHCHRQCNGDGGRVLLPLTHKAGSLQS